MRKRFWLFLLLLFVVSFSVFSYKGGFSQSEGVVVRALDFRPTYVKVETWEQEIITGYALRHIRHQMVWTQDRIDAIKEIQKSQGTPVTYEHELSFNRKVGEFAVNTTWVDPENNTLLDQPELVFPPKTNLPDWYLDTRFLGNDDEELEVSFGIIDATKLEANKLYYFELVMNPGEAGGFAGCGNTKCDNAKLVASIGYHFQTCQNPTERYILDNLIGFDLNPLDYVGLINGMSGNIAPKCVDDTRHWQIVKAWDIPIPGTYTAETLGYAKVTGKVVDFNGNPVAGAPVLAIKDTTWGFWLDGKADLLGGTSTNEDGTFTISGLPAHVSAISIWTLSGDWVGKINNVSTSDHTLPINVGNIAAQNSLDGEDTSIFYRLLDMCLGNGGFNNCIAKSSSSMPQITHIDWLPSPDSSGGSNTPIPTPTSGGGNTPSVPTCSIPKTSKPIVFVQKLSGGGEKCVLVTDSVSDLASLGLTALDEVYINDSSLIAQVRLFPGIGWNGATSLTLTKTSTNIGSYPGGFGRLVKSAKVDKLKDNCGNKTESGIYLEAEDGSCLYTKSSKTLAGTTWADRYFNKVYAKGNYIGKLYEYPIGGYTFEIDQKERVPSDRRLYGYLKVEGYEPCDRAKLNALGVAYGNTHEKWQGQCVVLGGAGTRINNTGYDIRVLYTGGKFIVRGWSDPTYNFIDTGKPYTEWGNQDKDYILLGWPYRAFLVEKKNNAPNPVIPHKEHGQQFVLGSPIDLCFNDGGDPDGDSEYFVIQIYRPYNPSVDFNSLLIEREQLNEAGCYRVKTSLPAGGYGYNIHAWDTGVFEPKQSPGMWGAFRVTDPATPIVTDATPNGTTVSKMPLICSDWVWKTYGTARFNLWRFDPNGWVGIGFNLWQPDRCWSPDQFGFNEPGTYQWEAVGKNSLNQTFNSAVYHTFVVAGDDPIKPANGSIHNGYVPQVCWPTMGTTVSAVLPTTKAAYAVYVTKDGYSYGDYPWVSGSCYQLPNLGNGVYTVQVDLNLWNNTYQAGSWKRSFTVTGMPDPITPQNGVTVASMPTLCQPQQGAWVVKYFFYLYTNNQYAGATPQSASTCWTPSYSFMNGNYKIVPAVVAWNGKIVTMPNFARTFVLNNTGRSGGGELETLDQAPVAVDISEADLLAIQGVIPIVSLYLPLVVTDTSTSVEIPQSEEQLQPVAVEEKQPADAKAIEQSAMTVQIFLPIVAK